MTIKKKNKYLYILLFSSIIIYKDIYNNDTPMEYRLSLKNSEASKYLVFSIISTTGFFGALLNIYKKNNFHKPSIHFGAFSLSCLLTGWKQFFAKAIIQEKKTA